MNGLEVLAGALRPTKVRVSELRWNHSSLVPAVEVDLIASWWTLEMMLGTHIEANGRIPAS